MIPSDSELKRIRNGLQIQSNEYFKKAHKFIELKKIFEPEEWIDWISLIVDLIIQPVYSIYKISNLELSLMDGLSVYKTHILWTDFLNYLILVWDVWYWKFMVRLVGGPWISTNDPMYHTLVYADAMTRLSCV